MIKVPHPVPLRVWMEELARGVIICIAFALIIAMAGIGCHVVHRNRAQHWHGVTVSTIQPATIN